MADFINKQLEMYQSLKSASYLIDDSFDFWVIQNFGILYFYLICSWFPSENKSDRFWSSFWHVFLFDGSFIQSSFEVNSTPTNFAINCIAFPFLPFQYEGRHVFIYKSSCADNGTVELLSKINVFKWNVLLS